MFEDFPNLHPLVVHLPIVLILLAAALQAVLVFKDWPQVRWIALVVMVGGFAGAVAVSTVFHALPTGLPPKAAAIFAEHEEYAGYTTWLSGITLLLAGIGYYFKLQRRAYEVVVLVAAVAAAGVLSVAGHRGAQLVYVEGVGPRGNLMMKDHHGSLGSNEMQNIDASSVGAHGQAAGQTGAGHDEAAKPAGMAFSKAFTLMGNSGAGQLTKMVNQICIAGLVQGLSEAVAFGEKAGLDMNQVLDVIGKGAAQSWQLDNRGKTMVADKFDFGFAVDWMRKDLGLVLDEAKRNHARLPVTALVDQFYADVQALGGQRWDTSSLIKRLK